MRSQDLNQLLYLSGHPFGFINASRAHVPALSTNHKFCRAEAQL